MDEHLIVLPLPAAGFDRFVSAWLVRDSERDWTCVVDPGPARSWPTMREAVDVLGNSRVDLVLLTHVHIDHAGAAGLMVREYGARVAVSARGAPHLLDPTRLWEGSVKTLGEKALLFGEPVPVPQSHLVVDGPLPEGFSTLETPGHASHHRCYIREDKGGAVLYAGEAAGVYLEGESPFPCLRPATPAPFFFDACLASLESLMKRRYAKVCYAHFGSCREAGDMLSFAKDQLLLWKDIALGRLRRGASPEDVEGFIAEALERDPFLAAWGNMEPAVREREGYYLRNSARGMMGAFAGASRS